ncbi:unnamed protein product, partial [marine sediment metagenome]
MALVVVTDEAYMRDFYHYVLQGHVEGIPLPEEEGFIWNVEGGETKEIKVFYHLPNFWYELGNKPDYLSSRKIYYYRAWATCYIEGELIKIYGELVQFTSINPNCTGFTNFEA